MNHDHTDSPVLELAPSQPHSADPMDQVQLLHDVAYLEQRTRAGLRLSAADRHRRQALLRLFGADPPRSIELGSTQARAQRRHRRIALMLPAEIKIDGQLSPVTLLNMSGGGLFLASQVEAKVGQTLLIKVRASDRGVRYSFPCRVIRARYERGAHHLALAFSGIPLQLRYNRHQEEPLQRAAAG